MDQKLVNKVVWAKRWQTSFLPSNFQHTHTHHTHTHTQPPPPQHTHTHTHTHNSQVVNFVVVHVFVVKEPDHLIHTVPIHTLQVLRGKAHSHNVGLNVWDMWVKEMYVYIHMEVYTYVCKRYNYQQEFVASIKHLSMQLSTNCILIIWTRSSELMASAKSSHTSILGYNLG